MTVDLDSIADAAVACALHKDADGYANLVRNLDADQLRAVAWTVSQHTATSMTERVEDIGLPHPREQALRMWQQVMLTRAARS